MKGTIVLILWILMLTPVLAREPIQVITEDLPPAQYVEDGIVKGPATEIVKKVLEKAGVDYKITVLPWARAYLMAMKYENILIYTMNRTAKREALFKWVGLVDHTNITHLFKLKGNGIKTNTVESIRMANTAVLRDGANHELLAERGFLNIFPVSKLELTIKMLLARRVDLIPGSEKLLGEQFNAHGYDFSIVEPVWFVKKSSPSMAMSIKTSNTLFLEIKNAYDQLASSGKIPNFEVQASGPAAIP